MAVEYDIQSFKSVKSWERWLKQNYDKSPGLWLRLAKKDSGIASVTYHEALEVALCYGWIDGQKRSDNAQFWLQKFTPRGKRSLWSKVNREKIAALSAAGRMHPAGLLEVQRAQADGRWEAAYDSARTASVPEDFRAALAANPAAQAFFTTLNASNRYAILFRLQTAKRAATREKNILKFVAMLEQGKTFHII